MPADIDPFLGAEAQAMDQAGYGNAAISRSLGLAPATIHDIVNRHGRWNELAERPVFEALRRRQNQILEAGYRTMAAKALVQCEKTIDKASAYQAAGISGLLLDKSRLLAGEPTSIEAHLNLHAAVSIDKLCDVLNQRLIEINEAKIK